MPNNDIYWHEKLETLHPELIGELQAEKLRKLIEHARENSPYYAPIMRSLDVRQIRSVEDITTLPFTEPGNLIEEPFQFKASRKTSRIHCSGGTMDLPKILFLTSEDVRNISGLAARKFYMMGVRRSDRIALMQPFDIYLIGFGHLEAHNEIGAEVMPLGVRLEPNFVMSLLRRLQPTVIDTSPSIILRLTNAIIRRELNPAEDFSIRRIILAGENITTSLREFVEKTWDARIFNDYGLMEMGIVAAECTEHQGMHVAADQYIVEVVDSASGEHVKDGEIGELVLTPLDLRGTPLIRYRTGDLVRITESRCACGRTHPLIEVIGRKEETLIVEGINLYPYQFDRALQEFAPEVLNYQIIYQNIGEEDWLRFVAEAEPSIDRSKMKSKITSALRRVSIDFLEILEKSSIKVDIEIVEPFTIVSTSRGKTRRFIDKRSDRN